MRALQRRAEGDRRRSLNALEILAGVDARKGRQNPHLRACCAKGRAQGAGTHRAPPDRLKDRALIVNIWRKPASIRPHGIGSLCLIPATRYYQIETRSANAVSERARAPSIRCRTASLEGEFVENNHSPVHWSKGADGSVTVRMIVRSNTCLFHIAFWFQPGFRFHLPHYCSADDGPLSGLRNGTIYNVGAFFPARSARRACSFPARWRSEFKQNGVPRILRGGTLRHAVRVEKVVPARPVCLRYCGPEKEVML